VADAGRIAEINVTAWRAAYRGLVADSYLQGMDQDVLRERWAAGLRNLAEPAAMFVAAGDDALIRAYAFVREVRDEADRHPDRRTGELIAIYADPAWLGTGAGYAVHRAALDHLATHGFKHAVLWVLSGNALARRFYEARGWSCDEVTKDGGIAGRPTPEIRYSRALPAREAVQPSRT
jgi:GNAT superfamily N-acetyltransferase